MMQFRNSGTKAAAVGLFALVWFVGLFAAHTAVGIYYAGKTLDASTFLLTTAAAFAVLSALFAVGARLLTLPFMYTVGTVFGLLLVERIFLRQYQITDWGVLTLLNLSADVIGFIVGAAIGGVVIRNRGQPKAPVLQ
jgi:hypothetical protein